MTGADPIQRAGQRLLSAAAVPIQAQIRCFLARRRSRERFNGVMTVQKYARRWLAETNLHLAIEGATTIQAAYRGWLTRDNLDDENYCATQIQRIVRGYIATLRVYEDMYNVTVVQSIVRRKLAINEATVRLYCVVMIQTAYRGYEARKGFEAMLAATRIQTVWRTWVAKTRYINHISSRAIQASFRGYIIRRDVEIQTRAVTQIATIWRGYAAQLNYQFDVVDIIIVQSVYRRRVACHRCHQLRHNLMVASATAIQKHWRSYDCMMNYLHTMADILIVQSVVRRWIACRFVPHLRFQIHTQASLQIQRIFRGALARISFTRVTSAMIIQNSWRTSVAREERARLWALKEMREAAEREYRASVQIQKIWRGFQCYTDFIFVVADVVIVQSTARRWLAGRRAKELMKERDQLEREGAAVVVQKCWRGYSAHMSMLFTLVHIIVVQSVVRRHLAVNKFRPMLAKVRAATIIQAKYRSFIIRVQYLEYTSARSLQSLYRMYVVRRWYVSYVSARRIQAVWRSYLVRNDRDAAAIVIQKSWRGFVQYSNYLILRFEEQAAVTIQRYWRGFWQYSHYVILHFEVVRIQALVRGRQERSWLAFQTECAIGIQSLARGYLAKKRVHEVKLISILVHSASLAVRTKVSSRKIQRWWRDTLQRKKEKAAGLIIERFFIGVKEEVDREIRRREKNRQAKREKRQRKKREKDEALLERVWLNTVKSGEELDRENEIRKAEEAAALELRKQRSRSRRNRNRQPSPPPQREHHDAAEGAGRSRRESPRRHDYSDPPLEQQQQQQQQRRSRRTKQHQQPKDEETHKPEMVQQQTRENLHGSGAAREHQVPMDHGVQQPPMEQHEAYAPVIQGATEEHNAPINPKIPIPPQPNHNTGVEIDQFQPIFEPNQPPPPTHTVDYNDGDGESEVSGITAPTIFLRQPLMNAATSSRFATLSRKELSDDLSLEEAWIDAEIHQVKEKKRSDDRYMKQHGLAPPPGAESYPQRPKSGTGGRNTSSGENKNEEERGVKERDSNPRDSRKEKRRTRSGGKNRGQGGEPGDRPSERQTERQSERPERSERGERHSERHSSKHHHHRGHSKKTSSRQRSPSPQVSTGSHGKRERKRSATSPRVNGRRIEGRSGGHRSEHRQSERRTKEV